MKIPETRKKWPSQIPENWFSVLIITACQQGCGMVMFSVMWVCQSTGGVHVTINHDVLDLTIQGPPWQWTYLKPASHIWWQKLESCSNLFTWGPHPTLVLISDGYCSTYCGRVSSMYPTRMLFYTIWTLHYSMVINDSCIETTLHNLLVFNLMLWYLSIPISPCVLFFPFTNTATGPDSGTKLKTQIQHLSLDFTWDFRVFLSLSLESLFYYW